MKKVDFLKKLKGILLEIKKWIISLLNANIKRFKKNKITYKTRSTIENIIIEAKFLKKIIKKLDSKKSKLKNLNNKIIIKKKLIY